MLDWLGEPEAPDEEPAEPLGTDTTTVEVGTLAVLLWVTRVVAGVSEAVVVESALAEPEIAVVVGGVVVVVVVSGLPVVEDFEEEDSVAEEDLVSVAVGLVEDDWEVEPV